MTQSNDSNGANGTEEAQIRSEIERYNDLLTYSQALRELSLNVKTCGLVCEQLLTRVEQDARDGPNPNGTGAWNLILEAERLARLKAELDQAMGALKVAVERNERIQASIGLVASGTGQDVPPTTSVNDS